MLSPRVTRLLLCCFFAACIAAGEAGLEYDDTFAMLSPRAEVHALLPQASTSSHKMEKLLKVAALKEKIAKLKALKSTHALVQISLRSRYPHSYFDRAVAGCAAKCNAIAACQEWPLPLNDDALAALATGSSFTPSSCGAELCFPPSEPPLFVVDYLESAGALTNHVALNFGCAVQTMTQTLSYDFANLLLSRPVWSGVGIDGTVNGLANFQSRVAGERHVETPAEFVSARQRGEKAIYSILKRVQPAEVAAFLTTLDVPMDPDILKIDIDSVDTMLLGAMLSAGYRPKVVHIESNGAFPPRVAFATASTTVKCSAKILLHSASCSYIHAFAREHDYIVASSFDIDLTLVDARLAVAQDFGKSQGCEACSGHRILIQGDGDVLPTSKVRRERERARERAKILVSFSFCLHFTYPRVRVLV